MVTTNRAIVNGYTFDSWMLEVLGVIELELGATAAADAELDDDFESWFCDGYTPREALREFLSLNTELLEQRTSWMDAELERLEFEFNRSDFVF